MLRIGVVLVLALRARSMKSNFQQLTVSGVIVERGVIRGLRTWKPLEDASKGPRPLRDLWETFQKVKTDKSGYLPTHGEPAEAIDNFLKQYKPRKCTLNVARVLRELSRKREITQSFALIMDVGECYHLDAPKTPEGVEIRNQCESECAWDHHVVALFHDGKGWKIIDYDHRGEYELLYGYPVQTVDQYLDSSFPKEETLENLLWDNNITLRENVSFRVATMEDYHGIVTGTAEPVLHRITFPELLKALESQERDAVSALCGPGKAALRSPRSG